MNNGKKGIVCELYRTLQDLSKIGKELRSENNEGQSNENANTLFSIHYPHYVDK